MGGLDWISGSSNEKLDFIWVRVQASGFGCYNSFSLDIELDRIRKVIKKPFLLDPKEIPDPISNRKQLDKRPNESHSNLTTETLITFTPFLLVSYITTKLPTNQSPPPPNPSVREIALPLSKSNARADPEPGSYRNHFVHPSRVPFRLATPPCDHHLHCVSAPLPSDLSLGLLRELKLLIEPPPPPPPPPAPTSPLNAFHISLLTQSQQRTSNCFRRGKALRPPRT